eukprot:UC1_evm1s1373
MSGLNGFHAYTWSDGDVYEGEWKNGKQHGRGKYTWSSGEVYEGEYKDDKRTGQGKFTAAPNDYLGGLFECDEGYKAHSVYEGGYHENKRHGVGILTEDGVSYSVKYSHGKQTSKTRTSSGVASVTTQLSHSARICGGSSQTPTAGSGGSPDIFISLRFGEALDAAKGLKAALEARDRGLNVFLCNEQAGADLMDAIVENISACKLAVVMGTLTYGAAGTTAFSTKEELKFIVSRKKPMFLVKMCDDFEAPLAQFHLGDSVMYHLWRPRTMSSKRSPPSDLVDAILAKLRSVGFGKQATKTRTIASMESAATQLRHDACISGGSSQAQEQEHEEQTALVSRDIASCRSTISPANMSKKNGFHKITFSNFDVYEGYWKDGKQHGQGKFTAGPKDCIGGSFECDEGYKAHSVYEGGYHKGKRHGAGILTENGVTYSVKYINGKQTYKTHTSAGVTSVTSQLSHGARISGGNSHAQEQEQEHQAASVQKAIANMSGRNGFHKVTFANGVYEGEWKDGKQHGRGKYTFASGNVYEGEWKDDKRTGRGKFTWPSGDVYEGEWKDGKRTGQGKFTAGSHGNRIGFDCDEGFKAHSVYEGGYHEGKRHGTGLLTEDGVSYSVEYSHGKQTSKTHTSAGTVPHKNMSDLDGFYSSTIVDGGVYEGEWKGGKFHGHGKYTWPDGNVYEGEWKVDEQHGRGTFTWSDGHVYEGEWKDDERTGRGKFTWPSGDVYEGEWKDGKRTGQGKFTAGSHGNRIGFDCDEGFKAHSVYEGGYHEGKRHGTGLLTEDGVSYSVEYSH